MAKAKKRGKLLRSHRATRTQRASAPTTGVTVSTAIIGSIALTLSATPAHAAEAPRDLTRSTGSAPAALRAIVASTAPADAAAAPVVFGSPASTKTVPLSYTVTRGDTVSAIAARHGLRTADVLAWNSLGWSSVIYPGDVLRLTAKGTATAPAPSAPAPSAPATSKPATTAGTHTVKKGDSLWAISQKYKVGLATLLSANALKNTSIIYPGQKIVIPSAASATPAPSTPAPSTPKPSAPKPSTPAPSTPAPSAPKPSTPATGTHTVAKGDSMWAIAQKHGVSLASLLNANALSSSSIIYPGQKIVIPGTASTGSGGSTGSTGSGGSTGSTGSPAGSEGTAPKTAVLDAEQTANAKIIIQVGRDRGVPDRGIAIALATAMVESWIRNLDWGDRDSLGLFQQRPSQGWGTPEQVRDPYRAAAVFYGGPQDPNGYTTRGLLDIPGWQSMSFTAAAQAVQISAYPDRYGAWEQQAYAWLAQLG